MARNSGTQNKQLGSEYSPKTEVDTQDLEVIKVLRYNATVLRWAIPIAITIFLASLAGIGYLAKSALMNEINQAINKAVAPIQRDIGEMKKGQAELARKVDRIEVKQENTIKRLDKLEDKR